MDDRTFVVSEELGIAGVGYNYAEAFADFGQSMDGLDSLINSSDQGKVPKQYSYLVL